MAEKAHCDTKTRTEKVHAVLAASFADPLMVSPSAGSLRGKFDLEAVQAQLVNLATTAAHVQQWLPGLIRRCDDTLETESKDMFEEMAALRTQNEGLKKSLFDAVDARNAAFRKLQHARRVIRDLLDERTEQVERTVHGNYVARITPEQLQQVLQENLDELPINSDEEDTVHLGDSEPPASGLNPTIPINPEPFSNSPFRQKTLNQMASPVSERAMALHKPSLRESTPPVTLRPNERSPKPVLEDEITWRIHYGKAPQSAMIRGPVHTSMLSKRVGLDSEMIDSLQSLIMSNEHSLRVQIAGDMAFVYDPIILEGTAPEAEKQTYLIDWGSPKINEGIQKYIMASNSEPFHTFVFPAEKRNWYYIGAYDWSISHLGWPLWPTLEPKSRDKLTAKLRDRCHDQNINDITTSLDDGLLQQLCVKISGVSFDISQSFAIEKLGFRAR